MLLLVRHSAPEIDPEAASEDWPLSEEGRLRCGALADRLAAHAPLALMASTEPKARETAELIAPVLGLDVELSDGLRETARRTVGWLEPDAFEQSIRELFERPAEVVFGEESARAALDRFEHAVADLPDPAVVVSHGTVMSLYVAARTGRDPLEIWRTLDLPDVIEV